jgi:hypothetical protein
MQDTLFALCGRDGDGSSRPWWRGAMGDSGRLRSDIALRLLHIARKPLGPAVDTTLLRGIVAAHAARDPRLARAALRGFAVGRRLEGREENA